MPADGSSQPRPPGARVARGRAFASRVLAAALVAAGVILWAAWPLSGGSAGTQVTLVIAIAAGAMSIAQLAIIAIVGQRPDGFAMADRLAQQLVSLVKILPWAEIVTVAVLVLETLHKSRPWHTAVLAVALTCYLLAVHLAETEASARVLRAQLPLLAAGAGLTALAVGAAALPGLAAGPGTALIRTAAVVLAAVVAGLAIPVWIGRGR
jgi:low affinity Fe/Cu permease